MRILCMRIDMPSNLSRVDASKVNRVNAFSTCQWLAPRCRRLAASDKDRCKSEMHALPSGGYHRHLSRATHHCMSRLRAICIHLD